MPLCFPGARPYTVFQFDLTSAITQLGCELLTVVKLLRIKNRLGKCRSKKLEFVEAMLVVEAFLALTASAMDDLLLPSPSGGCSRTAGEGGSVILAEPSPELAPEWSGVRFVSRGGGN